MVDIIVINNHSFVDTITNSSTELFVCDTGKSLELVKELLQELTNTYNKLHGEGYTYEYMFKEPYIGDDTQDEYWGECFGIGNTKGKIIIEGENDNSIPYEMFDLIELAFDARRCHIG